MKQWNIALKSSEAREVAAMDILWRFKLQTASKGRIV